MTWEPLARDKTWGPAAPTSRFNSGYALMAFLGSGDNLIGRIVQAGHIMKAGCILVKHEYPDLAGYELSWDAKMMIRGAWHCIEIMNEKPA